MEEYQYKRVIGGGFFSIVKKYLRKEDGKHYAVKELKAEHYSKEDYLYRFEREISLMERLKGHSNIIKIVDSGHNPEEKKIWYAAELASMNLHKYIKANNQTLDLFIMYPGGWTRS
ncbi:MAG: hypothetical protein P4L69_00505 [Desulfosporosinus sp.]|nr:hypothetical protein [Desulfosporosinus sp.]